MSPATPARIGKARRPCGSHPGVAGLLCLCLSTVGVSRGRAQSRPYYNITEISAKRLNNAVILTIKADGSMSEAHPHDYMYLDGWSPRPVKVLELHCNSAKSQVGNFVDISMYPISHVEVDPRSRYNDGIGLTVRVKLYTEARVRHFRTERLTDDWYWHPSMGCCFDGETGRNKQSFVWTVVSDRFAPPEAEEEEPARRWFRLEEGPADRYGLYCLNTDLDELANELGRRTGTQILVDQSVSRRVTVNLPEMTVTDLLQGIASAYGLALEDRAGQWVFSQGLPTNVATYETNVTRVVELEHLSPESALDLLPNFLLKYVKPSEAQNALIVAGPEQLVRRVREDVAKIDLPPQQLRVELTAVKIADADAFQERLRTEWAHGHNAYSFEPGAGALTYDYLGRPSRNSRIALRALDQHGTVDTLARAHVTLVNGTFARLFLGQERYIQVYRHTGIGDEQFAVPVSLGVRVNLGAWTGGEDIALWLRPIITALGGVDPSTNLPIVDRYETSGAIIVRDGHTVLLGGIRLRSRAGIRQNVRWLGLESGYGFLPPNRTRLREDSEIALFVSAKILGEFEDEKEVEFSGRLSRDLKDEGVELTCEPLEAPPEGALPPTYPARPAAANDGSPEAPPLHGTPAALVPQTGRTQS